jgi:nicotinamidase-related amidase
LSAQPAGKHADFLNYLGAWERDLKPVDLASIIAEARGPGHVGVFCVDVINGFCHEGALQSERVKSIIPPISRLMTKAHHLGVRNFVLTQDAHPEDAVEFNEFPPHCIRGTHESETVPELLDLPFSDEFTVIPKQSLNSAIGTSLDEWLEARTNITHRIVVGDCTDLCTYQLAMHLKLSANAANREQPVIIPADCVQTYDLPVDTAVRLGLKPHPGDLFHSLFLYHMSLNGCRVVSKVA